MKSLCDLLGEIIVSDEEMFEKNRNLVYFFVNKHYPKCRNDEDVIQTGFLGLWKACQNFDKSRGIKFSAFATKCILNEIGMLMKMQNKHIEVISLEDLSVEPGTDWEVREINFPFEMFSGKKRQYLELLSKGEKNIHEKLGVSRELLRRWRREIAERLKGAGYEYVG